MDWINDDVTKLVRVTDREVGMLFIVLCYWNHNTGSYFYFSKLPDYSSVQVTVTHFSILQHSFSLKVDGVNDISYSFSESNKISRVSLLPFLFVRHDAFTCCYVDGEISFRIGQEPAYASQ